MNPDDSITITFDETITYDEINTILKEINKILYNYDYKKVKYENYQLQINTENVFIMLQEQDVFNKYHTETEL